MKKNGSTARTVLQKPGTPQDDREKDQTGSAKCTPKERRPANVQVFAGIMAEIRKGPAIVQVNLAILPIFRFWREKTCIFARLSQDLPNLRKKTCTFALLWGQDRQSARVLAGFGRILAKRHALLLVLDVRFFTFVPRHSATYGLFAIWDNNALLYIPTYRSYRYLQP